MNKRILCVDFDGVVHSYVTRWEDAHIIPDPPIEGAFDALMAYKDVFDVQIYSSRSRYIAGIHAMKRWFIDHRWPRVEGTLIEPLYLSFPTMKPKAFLTIDDRGWTFTGTFPSVDELKGFKTWQGK